MPRATKTHPQTVTAGAESRNTTMGRSGRSNFERRVQVADFQGPTKTSQKKWCVLGSAVPFLRFRSTLALKSSDDAESELENSGLLKTPTRPGRCQSSLAITNSDETHPEPKAAAQALHPYYGPALDTPSKPVIGALQEKGPSLQWQYVRMFFVDEGGLHLCAQTFV
jgi:hypothetical protein